MTTYAADDHEAIRRRMEELKAERSLALTGSSAPAEEAKPAPDYGFYGLHGHDCVG